jgi:hypothetical protein
MYICIYIYAYVLSHVFRNGRAGGLTTPHSLHLLGGTETPVGVDLTSGLGGVLVGGG